MSRAADLHLTPNGKFLYMTERTSNSLATFSVDGASGKLIFLGSIAARISYLARASNEVASLRIAQISV